MGTFGQPQAAALDKDRNKERLKGSGSARRTKRGDQCEESQALHFFSRALNCDGQNGNQNSRARIVKSTGEAPEGSTKCAQPESGEHATESVVQGQSGRQQRT